MGAHPAPVSTVSLSQHDANAMLSDVSDGAALDGAPAPPTYDDKMLSDVSDGVVGESLLKHEPVVRERDTLPFLALPLPFCQRLTPLLALPLPFCQRLTPLLALPLPFCQRPTTLLAVLQEEDLDLAAGVLTPVRRAIVLSSCFLSLWTVCKIVMSCSVVCLIPRW